jgi:hypothetical protein
MQICSRCGRAAPDQESDEFIQWEAAATDGTQRICPDCLTREKETEMGEDFMFTGFEAELEGAETSGAHASARLPRNRSPGTYVLVERG